MPLSIYVSDVHLWERCKTSDFTQVYRLMYFQILMAVLWHLPLWFPYRAVQRNSVLSQTLQQCWFQWWPRTSLVVFIACVCVCHKQLSIFLTHVLLSIVLKGKLNRYIFCCKPAFWHYLWCTVKKLHFN